MDRLIRIEIGPEGEGERLDTFLSMREDIGLTRSYIKKLITDGNVTVDGRKEKPGHRLKEGQRVELLIPEPKELSVEAEEIPLDIIYEDSDLIAVNKPRGMVVHPAAGNYSGTLVNALMAHCHDLSGVGGTLRPGIVHRLDKDTSGVMVAAKNDLSHLSLAQQIKDRKVKKIYLAIVKGRIKEDTGRIDAPIGRHPVHRKKMAVTERGRSAVSKYRVIERFRDHTFVEVELETGRTHQIRVHMSYIGHPLVGDPVYSSRKDRFDIGGQALHSSRLEINHPRTGERMAFFAPLPEDMERIIESLRKGG